LTFKETELTSDKRLMYVNISLEELDRAQQIINDYLSLAKPSPFYETLKQINRNAFGEFDIRIIQLFMNKVTKALIGNEILLTDGRTGSIIMINPHDPMRPLVRMKEGIPTFLVVKEIGIVDTIWGMILPTAISTWNLIIMRTFFSNFPRELEEAGRIDGLNDLGIFIRVVLPLSQASLATVSLFYAVGMWNNFYSALLYLRTPDLFPLQVVLRNIVLAGQVVSSDVTSVGGDQLVVEESLKFATIIVSTVPILLVYPFLQKYFVKGGMIGSLKG
jgi:hypothetical protein